MSHLIHLVQELPEPLRNWCLCERLGNFRSSHVWISFFYQEFSCVVPIDIRKWTFLSTSWCPKRYEKCHEAVIVFQMTNDVPHQHAIENYVDNRQRALTEDVVSSEMKVKHDWKIMNVLKINSQSKLLEGDFSMNFWKIPNITNLVTSKWAD